MSYEVVVTRESVFWLADVPAIAGAHTFARSLPGLVASVHDVIRLMDNLDDDAEVDVRLSFDVDDPAVVEAVRISEHRRELAERLAGMQSDTARAAAELRRAGYSVRDTAALLDISPGRVSQLAA